MKSWWWRLARYARPQTPRLGGIMALMLVSVGIDAVKPWPMKLIVDNVLGGKPLPGKLQWLSTLPRAQDAGGLLTWLTFSTILLFLTGWLNRISRAYLESETGTRMVFDLGRAVFDHLQGLSLQFHTTTRTGDLVKRVTTDASCLRDLMMAVFLPALSALASLIVILGIMWRIDSLLALIAIAAAPCIVFAIRLFARPMEQRTWEQLELQGQLMSAAEQTLTALPIVRAFGREEIEDQRFAELCRRSDKAYLSALKAQLHFKIGTDSILAIGKTAVMAAGGWRALQGKISVGDLLILLGYLAVLYAPLETLAYISATFASAGAGARRIFEILGADERIHERAHARTYTRTRHSGHIRFESVTAGYRKDRPVLMKIELEAHPGERVALVGPTGAGKTTLVSLIPRLLDPWEGRVLFDGVDVRDWKLLSLRSQIAFLLQDPFILPITVAENIAYGRPDANRSEITAAAAAANADEFIRRLPDGYDTVLGERGATLSGGERQRLAIARALLKDAPILILDEPTSALDVRTEALLLEALDRLMKNRTTFIIAHRLSTVRPATRICVLDGGTIVESGVHEELVQRDGLYARYHKSQSAGSAETLKKVVS